MTILTPRCCARHIRRRETRSRFFVAICHLTAGHPSYLLLSNRQVVEQVIRDGENVLLPNGAIRYQIQSRVNPLFETFDNDRVKN